MAKKPGVPKKLQQAYLKRRVSLGGVADALGVSAGTARRMLVEAEVPIHGRGRPSTKPAPKPAKPTAPPATIDPVDPSE